MFYDNKVYAGKVLMLKAAACRGGGPQNTKCIQKMTMMSMKRYSLTL
jgi:hypothetical protein